MRRGLSLLLALLLLLPLMPGQAAASGSIRHEVHGDVSRIDVYGRDRERVNGTEAKIGTDVYLFVDPDTASYVTFYVTDEDGNPLKNAQIYLTYNGITEFFGTTDKNGKFSTYLFRDVEYGFTVKLHGYENAVGTFTATKELCKVRVVLRKYQSVGVFVVDHGVPVPGVTVIIEGQKYVTNSNGKVHVGLVGGVYNGTVVAPDGRLIPFQFEVDGAGLDVVIDIGLDETLAPGGTQKDNFLVYNRHYNPEDYVLTYYDFVETDLSRETAETDEEFEARTERYLQQNPSSILVEAQPDRRQGTEHDTDILDAQGEPIYSQRSLMPSGYLVKAWEEAGYSKLVFTNEEMGLQLDLADLHSPEMTKTFAMMWYLTENRVQPKYICKDEINKRPERYAGTGILAAQRNELEMEDIDLDALKDFEFEFVHKMEEHEKTEKNEKHDLLKDSLFTGTTFEFRVTPITPEALHEMVRDGLEGKKALDRNSIIVANGAYFLDVLRKWKAEGNLDDNEAKELYALIVDGRLTAEEIESLKLDRKEGRLTPAAIDLLLEAAMDENLYRVSCWARYQDVLVDITGMLDSLELTRKADKSFDAIYEELRQRETELTEEELTARAEKQLLEKYQFLMVDNEEELYDANSYKAGSATELKELKLIRSLPEENSEFYKIVTGKQFRVLTADVRMEYRTYSINKVPYYEILYAENATVLMQHRTLICEEGRNALTGLAIHES